MILLKKIAAGVRHAMHACYRYHYGVGVYTLRIGHRLRRWLTPRVRRVWQAVCAAFYRRIGIRIQRQWRKLIAMFAAIPHAWRQLRMDGKGGIKPFFSCMRRILRRGIKSYRNELLNLWRLLGPVAAAIVLVITLQAWSNVQFCLTLTYAGQELGEIQNEQIYTAAAALANERVMNVDNSFSVEAAPKLAVTIQRNVQTMDENELCDAILRTAGDSIMEASGLYVDGSFVGAMASADGMNALLDGIKDNYYDKTDADQRAEFVQNVQTVDGLFPKQSVVDESVLRGKLTSQAVVEKTYTVQAGDTLSTIAQKHDMTTGELRALNPSYASTDMVHIGDVLTIRRPESYLQVKVIKTIRYTEKIDYTTQYVNRSDWYVTKSQVKVKGQEGSQDVVAEVTYLDGVEQGRTVISRTVTKEPVTKVVERGTKKVYSSGGTMIQQGDGVTTGSMLWPVPICRNMSRGYSRGHYALDIANGPVTVNQKPCVAADGGTVVYAGWYYGYGNYVKIRHANGLETAYAHLYSISVVKGQQVSRGQQVGLIGNTGNSFGPHLHFEVIRNGVRVNPLNYVSPN